MKNLSLAIPPHDNIRSLVKFMIASQIATKYDRLFTVGVDLLSLKILGKRWA